MRAPPPVQYPLLPLARPWRWGLTVWTGLCASVAAWALLHRLDIPWLLWSGVGIVACVVGWFGWHTSNSRVRSTGHLSWDGLQWRRSLDASDEDAGWPSIQLDGGSWLLLRWRVANGRARPWHLVIRQQAPAAWHPLRVALRQSKSAVPDSGPTASSPPNVPELRC